MNFIQFTHESGRAILVNADHIIAAYNKPSRNVRLQLTDGEEIGVRDTPQEVRSKLVPPAP